MKKVALAVFIASLLVGCGSKSGEKEPNESKNDDKISTEMKAFMSRLTGNSDNTAAALKEFGKEGLATADMEMFNLENPDVKETNGNCYLIEAKSGMTKRKYVLCWESGKIVSVEDRGME